MVSREGDNGMSRLNFCTASRSLLFFNHSWRSVYEEETNPSMSWVWGLSITPNKTCVAELI